MSVAEQLPFPDAARTSDPDTSHAAADRMLRTAGELEQLIVDTIAASRFPMTAEQVADRIVDLHPKRWRWSSVVTAISRVRRNLKLIEWAEAEGKTPTGSRAHTLRIADMAGGHG